MEVVVDDLSGPEIAAFLEEHVQDMLAITPVESSTPSISTRCEAEVTSGRSWTRHARRLGAIRRLDDSHAEVKSMRTAADRGERRRVPAARASLAEASEKGSPVSLETGATSRPARPGSMRNRIESCGPFADYRTDPLSVFMTRVL